MTGLDLELFLRLLRIDYAVWASLGAVLVILALLAWTSWGSRRALRKCLFVSIAVHAGLALYGGTLPLVRNFGKSLAEAPGPKSDEHIKKIEVVEGERDADGFLEAKAKNGKAGRSSRFDGPSGMARLDRESPLAVPDRTQAAEPPSPPERPAGDVSALAPPAQAPAAPPDPRPAPLESRKIEVAADAPRSSPVNDPEALKSANGSAAGPASNASEPKRSSEIVAIPLPERDIRKTAGSLRPARDPGAPARGTIEPVAIARVTPKDVSLKGELAAGPGGRPVADVPEVYRPRLDPNRSAAARKVGADSASEQAVERALDWLARHQDADGRWNAGSVRGADGRPFEGESDFTIHCSPGEICSGACFYAEADTAVTGLALLAFLGAGYTQVDGKYAGAVSGGLEYLIRVQKADGGLQGESRSIAMYCHTMASLAICEAYALTGDRKLREPATAAVRFLVKGRSSSGRGWRYQPNSRDADTSVLGWVVMVLKSASEGGIAVPAEARRSASDWLETVSRGESGGLASYTKGQDVTPTMTAEAWVCRQFLGYGGPGGASDEAARYLMSHAPDTARYNLYYWYYGTLAMFQRGGAEWTRWNGMIRNGLVERQIKTGHSAGSWERDDDSVYGVRGGRIYNTAMATLTLEVYYRYLRLYESAPAAGDRTPTGRGNPPRTSVR